MEMSSEKGSEIRVREAKYVDLPYLVRNNVAMADEAEGIDLDPAVLEMGVSAVFDDPARGLYFIAEIGGTPAGSLMVTKEWSDWRCAWYWWIQSVYIPPEFRRRGVYTALHNHVVEAARKERAYAVRLYVSRGNESAIRTYKAIGMKRSHYDMFEIEL